MGGKWFAVHDCGAHRIHEVKSQCHAINAKDSMTVCALQKSSISYRVSQCTYVVSRPRKSHTLCIF